MLIHEFSNKDPDIVIKEAPLIILDSKHAFCLDNNGKDSKYTRHIDRSLQFVRNGEN